jgi:hypothetical protein
MAAARFSSGAKSAAKDLGSDGDSIYKIRKSFKDLASPIVKLVNNATMQRIS